MVQVIAAHVEETGTANTTVSFSLTAATANNRRLNMVAATGDTLDYSAKDGNGNWENARGTYSAANTITRPAVVECGSNGTSPVTFSGSVTITLTQNAQSVSRYGATSVTTIEASGSSQAIVSSSQGSCYDVTLSANCALTLSGGENGFLSRAIVLIRAGAGGFTPSFTNTIKWSNTTPPSGSLASRQILRAVFETPDNGTTWLGSY